MLVQNLLAALDVNHNAEADNRMNRDLRKKGRNINDGRRNDRYVSAPVALRRVRGRRIRSCEPPEP